MHKSVLLEESIEHLNIKSDGKYVDATLGYAGHSSQILSRLDGKGFLFAFEQDGTAVEYSQNRLSKISNNFKVFHTNFKNMKEYISCEVDGILFDLGVSSPQLDEGARGFSYQSDAPLDMRMDVRQSKSAYEVVNNYEMFKLIDIFYTYGEEVHAKAIAKAIVNARPINSTLELAEIIKKNVPEKYRNSKHPARKVFQAIRIEVNDEIRILEQSLLDAFSLLKSGGRLCVITFHSLEDRIVKNVFRKLCEDDKESKKLPFVPEEMKRKANMVTRKPIVPSEEEVLENNRSRSAKLRVIEKL